jgi:N-acetyltransferase 10
LGVGLQHKTVDAVAADLDLPSSQLLGLFNRTIRRCVQYLNSVLEKDVEKSLAPKKDVNMTPVASSLQEELDEAAKKMQKLQKKELEKLKNESLTQFAIKGSDEEWGKVLTSKGKKNIISVKSGKKRMHQGGDDAIQEDLPKVTKHNKKKPKK